MAHQALDAVQADSFVELSATTKPAVTVLITRLNEAGNVNLVVEQLSAAFGERAERELFYVDDSSDDTPSRLEDIQPGPRPVRLLHRKGNARQGLERLSETASQLLMA